jgi:hypothetical protein
MDPVHGYDGGRLRHDGASRHIPPHLPRHRENVGRKLQVEAVRELTTPIAAAVRELVVPERRVRIRNPCPE